MLRIERVETSIGDCVLRLEGEVVGPWVAEIRRSCDQALATGARLTLELTDVTFIDRAGVEVRLVERLQAGDATALEGLMERYSSRLYRLAFGITRNARDAEEVLQDVFLTVFRKIGSFERRAKLGTWLYRVATNTALNKRRGLAATVEVPLDDLLPTYLDDGHRAG